MRLGPMSGTKDPRTISAKRIRRSERLPLQSVSSDKKDLIYHEAQTSSLSWGADEWFWTEIFLVDTYFGSEENRHEYLSSTNEGQGLDPPLGGTGSLEPPQFDPREYFLRKLDCRIGQAVTEYSSLVETFNARMENYVGHSIIPGPSLRESTTTMSNQMCRLILSEIDLKTTKIGQTRKH